ncbi:MarR family transcriptional regulator [Heliobacterium chlorum]|uniref:MarR family transcriptional regulator n=1 Tax=Heliobacterium chlorum TaxID=2698 RepID=A0ABR7T6I6_HELCL|nr:MarR family transcriptional regulator [Heliobacterium chlorum]MBC9785181.1 MarR family transcriptional regulator [Heliobacterium chlorum]
MSSETVDKESYLARIQALLDEFFYNIKQATQDVGADIPLAEGQIFLLYLLWKFGPCKSTYIAGQLGITSGAVTGMTDKLAGLDLLTRERSLADRRVVMLSLTEQGLRLIERVNHRRFERISTQLRSLSLDDLSKTVDVLAKMNGTLRERAQ